MRKVVYLSLSILLIFWMVGVVSAADPYTHPSGAFSLNELGTLEEEADNGALFVDDTFMMMVLFGSAQVELSEETASSLVDPVLNGIDAFESYELLLDSVQSLDNGYLISFQPQPAEDYGQGEVFVTYDGEVLYMVVLLAADYEGVAEAWQETIASFTPNAAVVEAEEPAEEGAAETEEETPGAEEEVAPPSFEGSVLSGFQPELNGFSFQNYGSDIPATDLTPAELQRMFGDQVCANLANNECTLAPPAQQWMEQINSYMDGGHCEGMAVLSTLMYYDQVNPADFGGSTAYDLAIENNDPLQREIAYWWTTQSTYPGSAKRINESPSAVLDALIETFQQGPEAQEWWAMGFYRRDGSAGHAVTPIGVEDQGNGLYHILIYDNNFPNEVRAVKVDRNTDTWSYEGSPNPEIESFLYDGDASLQNLEIVAISPRLEQQNCDFCAGEANSQASGATSNLLAMKQAAPAAQTSDNPVWQNAMARWNLLTTGNVPDYYQVWLIGKPDLLVVDDWGRRIGFVEGEFVDEIPGASVQKMRVFSEEVEGLDKDKSPVYRIPVGLSFEVIVDASQLEEADSSDVSMIGPGYYLDVSGVWLEPGEQESIKVYTDKSRQQLTYWTNYTESPTIELGFETEEAGYAMMVRATELTGAEDTFDIALDTDTNEFILNTSGNAEPSTYEVMVLRVDDESERVFGTDEMVMDPENTAYIPFAEWSEESNSLRVDFDYENDGEIDDTYDLPDITAEVADFYEEEE